MTSLILNIWYIWTNLWSSLCHVCCTYVCIKIKQFLWLYTELMLTCLSMCVYVCDRVTALDIFIYIGVASICHFDAFQILHKTLPYVSQAVTQFSWCFISLTWNSHWYHVSECVRWTKDEEWDRWSRPNITCFKFILHCFICQWQEEMDIWHRTLHSHLPPHCPLSKDGMRNANVCLLRYVLWHCVVMHFLLFIHSRLNCCNNTLFSFMHCWDPRVLDCPPNSLTFPLDPQTDLAGVCCFANVFGWLCCVFVDGFHGIGIFDWF